MLHTWKFRNILFLIKNYSNILVSVYTLQVLLKILCFGDYVFYWVKQIFAPNSILLQCSNKSEDFITVRTFLALSLSTGLLDFFVRLLSKEKWDFFADYSMFFSFHKMLVTKTQRCYNFCLVQFLSSLFHCFLDESK